MILYPAIDLLDGEVVRLYKGDFAQRTVFSTDPNSILKVVEESGAKYMHLVDLSGAQSPDKRQFSLLKKLLKQSKLQIQVGGGIRSLSEIAQLLDCGADRVVIGSMAISSPDILQKAIQDYGPKRITLALDVKKIEKNFIVMYHGWQSSSQKSLSSLLQTFNSLGIQRILCTDIEQDGAMKGPNFDLYCQIQKEFPQIEIQASGGIAKLNDIIALKKLNLQGAIIGRAWLNQEVDLKMAVSYAL